MPAPVRIWLLVMKNVLRERVNQNPSERRGRTYKVEIEESRRERHSVDAGGMSVLAIRAIAEVDTY